MTSSSVAAPTSRTAAGFARQAAHAIMHEDSLRQRVHERRDSAARSAALHRRPIRLARVIAAHPYDRDPCSSAILGPPSGKVTRRGNEQLEPARCVGLAG